MKISSIYRAFLVSDNNNTKQLEDGIDNKGYDGYGNNNAEKVPSETGTNLFNVYFLNY